MTNSKESGIPFKQQLKDWETLVETSSEQYWDITNPDHVLPPLSPIWNDTPVPVPDASREPPQRARPSTCPQLILRPPTPSQVPRTPTRTNLHDDFNAEGEEPVEQPSSPSPPQHSDTEQQPSQSLSPILPCCSNRIRNPPERFSDSEHSTMSVVHLTSKKIWLGQFNDSILHNLNWDKSQAHSSVDYSNFYAVNVARTIDPYDGTTD